MHASCQKNGHTSATCHVKKLKHFHKQINWPMNEFRILRYQILHVEKNTKNQDGDGSSKIYSKKEEKEKFSDLGFIE